MLNLISNAVKYSGNAVAPQIEIGSYKQDGQLVFFVKDNIVYTHPADQFILNGITRQIVIDLCNKLAIKRVNIKEMQRHDSALIEFDALYKTN